MNDTARILVADAEDSIRFVLREALESAGHKVEEVDSGDAALDALAKGRYDLAFLDKLVLVSGPDKNGKPHIWSLAPDNEAMYRTISHFLGANRKHGVVRIDITEKVTAVQ